MAGGDVSRDDQGDGAGGQHHSERDEMKRRQPPGKPCDSAQQRERPDAAESGVASARVASPLPFDADGQASIAATTMPRSPEGSVTDTAWRGNSYQ